MRASRAWRGATGAFVAFALLATLPGVAHAAYDPLASGTAKLTFAPGFRALLRSEGIEVTGRKGVVIKARRTAIFPVIGGEADPATEKGSFELGGELIVATKARKVALNLVTVNTKTSPLYAKVAGGQQKVAKAGSAAFDSDGFAYGYEATGLRLSSKTAARLDKRLKVKAFDGGRLLGNVKVSADPATVTIVPQGEATLSLAPAFVAKLASLFVSRNPIFPAEHQEDVFSLPIAIGSQLAPDASRGTLRTGGAIELLQLGGGQLFWHELWFQPEGAQVLAEAELDPSPPYPGKQGQVGVFALGAGQVSSDPATGAITVTGAPITLTALTAQNLNEAFSRPLEKGDLFTAGEAVGAVSFTAQAQ